ncbi:MAG: hypothetical protein C5B51_23285 [Terriglobia bacterium]|nr:MAG: hypothetical protein C5B51_23285 [Terriglobia bacterium]
MDCPQCGTTTPAGTLSCAKCSTPFETSIATMVTAAGVRGGWSTVLSGSPNLETTPPEELSIGTVLGGRYELLQLLGEGGMGAVYKVRDHELDRIVALKVIRPELARNAAVLQRFKRELILAREITHKNVIRIFDLGTAAGVKFITMDFVEGKDAAALLHEQRKFAPRLAARMISQACLGLGAAHAVGVIHRDLKPQNMMINAAGDLVLMDFGIARSLSEDGGMTRTGAIMGTPTYMSPEQGKGEKVDQRSDIYALGIIFYEFLTGKAPFESETAMGTLLKRLQEPAPSPSKLDPTIPEALSDIVLRCLQLDPAKRYQTAEEMRQDLEAWLGPESGTMLGVAPAQIVRAKRIWERIAIALSIALVTVTGVILLQRSQKPPPPHKSVSVLVADFDNQTGDPVFDGTFEPMLGFAMEGASFVSAFNRADARKTGAQLRKGAARLDAELARLVAVREGIDVVVAGAIKSDGGGYVLSVTASEPGTGKQIVSRQEKASSKEKVLTVVGKLAAPVRKALGDASPESKQLAAAETFSAASLEAAHQYSLGQDYQWSAKWDDAIRAYSKAVELDPTLGRAYAGLAVVYYNLGQREKAEPYFSKAMSLIDRMTDRERYRTRGGYFIRSGDIPSAIDEFTRLVQQYHADSAALNNLALAYSLRREMAKAVTYARQSSGIYPKSAMRRANVSIFSMYAGDFAAADKEAQATIALNPDYPKAFIVRGLSQLAQGKVNDALESYKHVESSLSPSSAAIALADLALYQGRLADARGVLDPAITRSRAENRSTAAARQLLLLAQVHLLEGHKPDAIKAAGDAVALDQSEEGAIEAARILALAGNDAKARSLVAPLASKLNKDYQAYAKIVEGDIFLEHGDALGAVQQLRQAQALADTWLGRFDLGRAYLAAGAFVEAHAAFTACQSRRGEATALFLDEVPTYHYYPPTLYYLGRVLEQMKSAAAADSYRAFLAMKTADSSEPIVADARRRLGTL